jgi:hypothetical protein
MGRVTPPTDAQDDDWVRCPICGAEYKLRRVLEYVPPRLEVIDEPVAPSPGRMPSWDAAAAPAMAPAPIPVAAPEIAAPRGQLPEVELLATPPTNPNASATSADVADESDDLTFDESLLLDDSDLLDESEGTLEHPGSASVPFESMSDSVFDQAVSSDSSANAQFAEADRDENEFGNNGPASNDNDPVVFEARGRGANRRTRRSNPLFMIAGIVGGGVLGLAIGYAILMWVFAKDPFSLGDTLPGFLVPSALRSRADLTRTQPSEPAGGQSQADDSSEQSSQEPSVVPFDQLSKTAGDDAQGGPPTEPSPSPDTAATSTDSVESSLPPPVIDPLANEVKEPTGPALTDTGAKPETTANAAGDDHVGLISERKTTAEQLQAAISAARSATEAAITMPANADQRQKNAANLDYYTSLSRVADVFTHFQAGDDAERQQGLADVRQTLAGAAPTAQQLAVLAALGNFWFKSPQGDGAVLVGTVKDSKPSGKLVVSQVEPLGGGAPIPVVSLASLAEDPKRPVLIAGTIVKNPAENLAGYQGTAERVVWAAVAFDPESAASPQPDGASKGQ